MIVREVLEEEKEQFNQVATHPLQSWEWGEFRQKTGIKVIRLGAFDPSARSGQAKLKAGYQLTVHPIPKTPWTILYFPKGPMPDNLMLDALKKLGQNEGAILVKLEPNLRNNPDIKNYLLANGCRPGQPLFTKYTYQLDLTKTEEQILAAMKPKTRYNIRVAHKHGIEIIEDNSKLAFDIYLKLILETTQRQGFYAHSPEYHQLLWETLSPTGMYHLFLAKYQKQILAAYVFFVFNQVLYYPYGASTRLWREVMAPHALFWEAIKFGKKQGCKMFDMWGSLGPNPDPKDPWYGFHRFKEGFGGELVEFLGTYDLVINPQIYPLYNLANSLRWKLLRLKSKICP